MLITHLLYETWSVPLQLLAMLPYYYKLQPLPYLGKINFFPEV